MGEHPGATTTVCPGWRGLKGSLGAALPSLQKRGSIFSSFGIFCCCFGFADVLWRLEGCQQVQVPTQRGLVYSWLFLGRGRRQ